MKIIPPNTMDLQRVSTVVAAAASIFVTTQTTTVPFDILPDSCTNHRNTIIGSSLPSTTRLEKNEHPNNGDWIVPDMRKSSLETFWRPPSALAITTLSSVDSYVQYNTAVDIPQEAFERHDIIYGKVERVYDGDTIRVRHYPLYPSLEIPSQTSTPVTTTSSSKNNKPPLSSSTISIRLYGIDAPEMGKNGNPSMFKAEEAKEFTKQQIDGKIVRIKLLSIDRYSRVIGEVMTMNSSGNVNSATSGTMMTPMDLSIGLIENGYATLYKGKGAEYDDHQELLQKKLATAQREKKGMWVNGVENVLTPAEYKRSLKE